MQPATQIETQQALFLDDEEGFTPPAFGVEQSQIEDLLSNFTDNNRQGNEAQHGESKEGQEDNGADGPEVLGDQPDVKEITQGLVEQFGGEAGEWNMSEAKIDNVGVINGQGELMFKGANGQYEKTSDFMGQKEYQELMGSLNSGKQHFTEITNIHESKKQVVVMHKSGNNVFVLTFWRALKKEEEELISKPKQVEEQNILDEDDLDGVGYGSFGIFLKQSVGQPEAVIFAEKNSEAQVKEQVLATKSESGTSTNILGLSVPEILKVISQKTEARATLVKTADEIKTVQIKEVGIEKKYIDAKIDEQEKVFVSGIIPSVITRSTASRMTNETITGITIQNVEFEDDHIDTGEIRVKDGADVVVIGRDFGKANEELGLSLVTEPGVIYSADYSAEAAEQESGISVVSKTEHIVRATEQVTAQADLSAVVVEHMQVQKPVFIREPIKIQEKNTVLPSEVFKTQPSFSQSVKEVVRHRQANSLKPAQGSASPAQKVVSRIIPVKSSEMAVWDINPVNPQTPDNGGPEVIFKPEPVGIHLVETIIRDELPNQPKGVRTEEQGKSNIIYQRQVIKPQQAVKYEVKTRAISSPVFSPVGRILSHQEFKIPAGLKEQDASFGIHIVELGQDEEKQNVIQDVSAPSAISIVDHRATIVRPDVNHAPKSAQNIAPEKTSINLTVKTGITLAEKAAEVIFKADQIVIRAETQRHGYDNKANAELKNNFLGKTVNRVQSEARQSVKQVARSKPGYFAGDGKLQMAPSFDLPRRVYEAPRPETSKINSTQNYSQRNLEIKATGINPVNLRQAISIIDEDISEQLNQARELQLVA